MSDVNATAIDEVVDDDALASASGERMSDRKPWWNVLFKQTLALTGAIIVGFFAVVALIGPFFAPYGATDQLSALRLSGPSWAHPFGNDEFGRDILSRVLYGSRISFQVGVIAVGISAVIGVVLGLIAGYFGGMLDTLLTLLMDVLFAFPAILLAIALMAMLGNSLGNVMIAIGVVNAPTFMRVVR